MSMFSDFAHASEADSTGEYILKQLEDNPQDKEVIEKYLLPLYEKQVNWSEGCHNRDLEKEVKRAFKW